ncbi:MAG: hypothetical protein J6M60_05650 [Clostridia bacterium]|nr:hypothetical protein [Clostridia bacterium]
MSKEDIFSKIQIVDYNNVLEKVLEVKDFSVDVKNLLLDMFYKIENGYEDYKTIKINVASKKVFLKKVVEIVQNKCNKIVLVKPMSEESKELEDKKVKYLVDKEKGIIKVYHNERMLLEALISLNQNEITLDEKYNLYEKAITSVLLTGDVISNSEVIRDFDGWSWGITPSQMINKNVNIIYQNMLILLGNSFIQKWITGKEEQDEVDIPNNEILRSKYNSNFGLTTEEIAREQKVDYISLIKENLEEKCGKENTDEFLDCLIKAIIVMGCNASKKQKIKILKESKKVSNELEKMQDNRKYLESLSAKKRRLAVKIGELDKILSDDEFLKKDYEERNLKLENKDKIFSVSHLVLMYKKSRKEYVNEIEKCNKMMEPKSFVKNKGELQRRKDFFDSLNIKEDERTKESKYIEGLEISFLKCFLEIVKKTENKFEIEKLLYEIRYFEHIPYNTGNLGKMKKIQSQIKEIEQLIISKACKIKILSEFTDDKELNYSILRNLFDSKIANLSNTIYVLKYQKDSLKIKIYDSNVEENDVEIQIKEKTILKVKLNKKIKVFE